jgi:hypothetical protein
MPCPLANAKSRVSLPQRVCVVAGFLVALATCSARADDGHPPAHGGVKRALILCGLPGDNEHRELYAGAVETIRKALVERCGFSESEVAVRFGTEPRPGDGPALSSSRGLSTREGIEDEVKALRQKLRPEDALWVIVLGHGHLDGRHAHWNLPGPDLSDDAFGKLFAGLKATEQVFMITTSSSGFFLKPLSAPGRVVITATEPDQEVNETLFPLALAEVLKAPPSDIDRDKDGSVSLFDLYLAVVTDVLKRYADAEDLPTEHARLDDNGDGHGSELQLSFLPPEILDPSVKLEEPKKGASRKKPPKKAEPRLGPRDDGNLAAKIRIDARRPAEAQLGSKTP